MTREEQIEKFIKFHAHKFSVRNGYETTEELMREMAQWCDEHPKNPWISVEDKLPEKAIGKSERSEYVLCRHKNGSYYVAYWHVGLEYWYSMPYMIDKSNITHWMPIPEL